MGPGQPTMSNLEVPNLEDSGSNWVTYKERVVQTLTHQGLERHLYGTAPKPEELREVDGKWFNKEEPTKPLTRKEIKEHDTKIDIFVQQEATVREVIYQTVSQYTFLRIYKEETSAELWIKLISLFEDEETFTATLRSIRMHAEKRVENAMVIAEKGGEESEEKLKEKSEESRSSTGNARDAECCRRGGEGNGQEPQEEKTTSTNAATSSDTSKDVARAKTSYPREETPAQSTPGSSPRTVDRIPESRNSYCVNLANKLLEIRLEMSNACEVSTKNANPSEITADKEDEPNLIEKCEYTIQDECPKPRKTETEMVEGHTIDFEDDSASHGICRADRQSGTVTGNVYLCRNDLPEPRTVQIEGKNPPHISSPCRSIKNKVDELPRANRHLLKASRPALERSNNRPKPPENGCATDNSSSKLLRPATKNDPTKSPDMDRRDRKPLGTASSRPPRQKTEIRSDESPDVNRRELKPYRTAFERANNQPKRMKNGLAMDSPSSNPNINLPRSPPDPPSSKDYQSDPRSDLESPIRHVFRGKRPPGTYRKSASDTSPSEPGGMAPALQEIKSRNWQGIPREDEELASHLGVPTHLSSMVNDVEPRGSVQEEPTIDRSAVKRPNRDISTSTIIHTRFAHIKMIQQYILLLYQVYFTYLQAQIPPSRLRGSVEIQAHLQYLT